MIKTLCNDKQLFLIHCELKNKKVEPLTSSDNFMNQSFKLSSLIFHDKAYSNKLNICKLRKQVEEIKGKHDVGSGWLHSKQNDQWNFQPEQNIFIKNIRKRLLIRP